MKELLPTNSPKYLRRLIRQLNCHLISGDSVYARDYPSNQKIISVSLGKNTNQIIAKCADLKFRGYDGEYFYLGNGEQIVASREI